MRGRGVWGEGAKVRHRRVLYKRPLAVKRTRKRIEIEALTRVYVRALPLSILPPHSAHTHICRACYATYTPSRHPAGGARP